MKTIGLAITYKGTNYGALLQAYATQYVIESMGFNTEIINYKEGKDHRFRPSIEAISYLSINKIKKLFSPHKTNNIVLDQIHKENKDLRVIAANNFRAERLKNIVNVDGFKNLQNQSKKYEAVIVGSDQLWEPNVSFSYFYSLMFAPKGVKRISYATSMGVSSYPWYVKRQAAIFLNRIDYLSIREEQGRKIIKSICGREATVVLDPTYLISKDEWESLIPEYKVVDSGYVLCFFLGSNMPMKEKAKEYARQHELRVVSILSNEVSENDAEFADEVLIGRSPEDFINLIRGANCVFTDSFHCFTFCIINEIQVFVTYRVRQGLASRNSRIDNIVDKFGVQDRLVKDPKEFVITDDEIDYMKVNEKVNRYILESKRFLKNALGYND